MSDEETTAGGLPLLLKMSTFQRVYQNHEEVDADGNVLHVKLQATQEFKDKFNELVHKILLDCIRVARESGRKTLWPDDVPRLEEVE